MQRIDRFIVPGTVVAAMLAMFFVTNAWIRRPTDALQWRVTMGPLGIDRAGHPYGLRFTPRNVLSGHAITGLVTVSQNCRLRRQCVDVTIVNTALTYIYRTQAYRLPDGSYRIYSGDKVGYAFPRDDDYVVFVEMRPRAGDYQAKRIPEVGALRLGRCRPPRRAGCPSHRALLRGQEVVRSGGVDGLTVVLGAPVRAIESGRPAQVGLVYLRGGRTATDVTPRAGADDAVAISMDTYHFVHLHVDPAHSSPGVVAYTGEFDAPSIYRVWAPVPAHRAPTPGPIAPEAIETALAVGTPQPTRTAQAQASFVVDVDPAPTPTPVGQ